MRFNLIHQVSLQFSHRTPRAQATGGGYNTILFDFDSTAIRRRYGHSTTYVKTRCCTAA